MLRKGQAGGLLRRCRQKPGNLLPSALYTVQIRYCSAAKVGIGWSTGCRTERPLRVGPGRSAALRPTGVVKGAFRCVFLRNCPGMRVTRGKRRTSFSVLHRRKLPRRGLRRSSIEFVQWIAQPAEAFQTRSAVSEKSPVGLCVQRPESAFLLDRARPVFFGQDPKKMGETGEAPPAAETASLFRGSGTIGGPNGAGNRIAATVVCKPAGLPAISRAETGASTPPPKSGHHLS